MPNPINSYRLLAGLGPTVDHLQQVVRRLSDWHRRVVDGREYFGEDEIGDGVTGTLEAAEQLEAAAAVLNRAGEALRAAHAANGVIRWVGE